MALQDEFGFDSEDAHRRLEDHPVEPAPTEEFERQVRNSASVDLLLRWMERLTQEVDQLRGELEKRDASG